MDEYRLFKFRSVNERALEVLGQRGIYFAKPDTLNDPFDCRVDVRQALENAIRRSKGEARALLERCRALHGFYDQLAADIKTLGVCSFCLNLDNALMWSHYAAAHSGMALYYVLDEAFFHGNADHILGIDRVDYGTNPVSDWLIHALPEPGQEGWERYRDGLLVKLLTAKSPAWAYENEGRIVRRTDGGEVLSPPRLKQVCFDCKQRRQTSIVSPRFSDVSDTMGATTEWRRVRVRTLERSSRNCRFDVHATTGEESLSRPLA